MEARCDATRRPEWEIHNAHTRPGLTVTCSSAGAPERCPVQVTCVLLYPGPRGDSAGVCGTPQFCLLRRFHSESGFMSAGSMLKQGKYPTQQTMRGLERRDPWLAVDCPRECHSGLWCLRPGNNLKSDTARDALEPAAHCVARAAEASRASRT